MASRRGSLGPRRNRPFTFAISDRDRFITEGNFGLVHALSKFDPERKNRFLTYAIYWIRAYILNYVINCWSLVGMGSGPLRSKVFFKLRRERARIHNLVGAGEHADALLAERFGVSIEQMAETMQRLEARDLSLDRKVFDGETTSLVETLTAPDYNQEQAYAEAQENHRLHEIVHAALGVLDSREQLIIRCHVMRDADDELSIAAIGRHLGISRERARQLEERAKRKLRQRILELSGDEKIWSVDIHSAA